MIIRKHRLILRKTLKENFNFMKKKSIMVLGANGFLGKNFIKFVSENHLFSVVYKVDNKGLSKKKKENFFKCDIIERKELKKLLKQTRPDYIFHFAGLTNSSEWKEFYEANVETTCSLFDSVQSIYNYKPRIIIAGSAAEYGQVMSDSLPIKEDSMLNPNSKYGVSMVWRYYAAKFFYNCGLEVISCRIFNILGPGLPENLSIASFVKQIVDIERGKTKPFISTGNLTTKRDFLDVSDIVNAVLLSGLKGKSGESYNICSGKSEYIKKILFFCIKHSKVKNLKIRINKIKIRKFDIADIYGSNVKITRNLGWKQKVSLEESIIRTLNYYRNIGKHEK